MSIGIIRNLGGTIESVNYSADLISQTSASNWNAISGSPSIVKIESSLQITANGYADTYTECDLEDICGINESSTFLLQYTEDRGSNAIEIKLSEDGLIWSNVYSVTNSAGAKTYAEISGINTQTAKMRIRYKNSSSSSHTLNISVLKIRS